MRFGMWDNHHSLTSSNFRIPPFSFCITSSKYLPYSFFFDSVREDSGV